MALANLKNRFLIYFNKEDFDHTVGIVNPFEYHSLFLVMVRLFSVMDNERIQKWMYISPVAVFISASTAFTILLISLVEYVSKAKVHAITECGSYLIVMVGKLLILYSIQFGKKHYHKFLQALRDDFRYVCTEGVEYRERFFGNQLLTFKLCFVVAIFEATTGIGIAVSATFALLYVLLIKEDAVRPLPFSFWIFGFNLHASPVYEILFIASIMFTLIHVYQYVFQLVTQVLWVRQITCKADMITWHLQDLLIDVTPAKNKEEQEYFNALIKHRMRAIIRMHHSMIKLTEEYSAIFKKLLLYEQVVSSPIICMTAYCFTEKLKVGEIQLVLLLLCIAVIVVVLIPCYLCTHLLEKCQSVADACWDIPFWNAGPVVRVYLVLMMQRSMRPLPLVAAGFADISLQTYSTILGNETSILKALRTPMIGGSLSLIPLIFQIITRAYSCFNMLRQADFNIT